MTTEEGNTEVKACPQRFIILTIFIIYAGVNAFEWVEYSIINNIAVRYYDVSPSSVDWTTVIYMAFYAPLILPISYFMDKKGLRFATLCGSILTAIGTAVKVFSIGRDYFWVVLLGQAILALAQVFILSLPARIAAVWFKEKEVSTACSVGVFGTLFGCALGFFLPPIIVPDTENIQDIEDGLKILCWSLTAFALPAAIAVIIYFPDEPKKPPSVTQLEERANKQELTSKMFISSLLELLRNKPFLVHVLAYGFNIGVFCALSALLNQLILEYFSDLEDAAQFAGRAGLLLLVVGMFGVVIFGYFLDRTRKYKETTAFLYFLTTAGLIGFLCALEWESQGLVYFTISVVGLAMNSYMPIGYEFGIELTYPSSETTTSGIIMAAAQAFGTILSLVMGQLNAEIGAFWSLAAQTILLAIGTVMTCLIPNIKRRQEAFKQEVQDPSNMSDIPEDKIERF